MDDSQRSSNRRNEQKISSESLARFWPNRVHESNWLENLACQIGLHPWFDLELGNSSAKQVLGSATGVPKLNIPKLAEVDRQKT